MMIKRLLLPIFFMLGIMVMHAQPVIIGGDSLALDYGNPKEYIISNVRFDGNVPFDANLMLATTGLITGQKISPRDLAKEYNTDPHKISIAVSHVRLGLARDSMVRRAFLI